MVWLRFRPTKSLNAVNRRRQQARGCLGVVAIVMLLVASCPAAELRIASYNIDCFDQSSDDNITASFAGLPTVLAAIGQHHIGTSAQPIDVLGAEELNSTTLPNLVAALNNIYGSGTYAYDLTDDPNTGGGTDGLLYNTHTVQVISATVIGTASTSGAARAPIRYQLRPVGFGSDADFYMYVSHYKASTGSTNQDRRNVEATEIRQDADALGANAHIIYSGDFNLTGGSSEPAWATLTSAGSGKAYDPTGASGWTNNSSTWKHLYSESTDTLNARFDFQLVSGAILNQPGLQLASDTSDPFTNNFPSSKYPYAYEVFGNNGTTAVNAATSAAGNTSVGDLANGATVLNDLMQFNGSNQFVGSDHLPVVADYVLVGVKALPAPGDFDRDGRVTVADVSTMMAALSNLSGYESSQGLTDSQLQLIGNLNGDGKVTDADLQSLIDRLANSGGGGTVAPVPEPSGLGLITCAIVSLAICGGMKHHSSARRKCR